MAIWRRMNEKDPTGPFDRSLTLPLEAVLASPSLLVPRRIRSRLESDGAASDQRFSSWPRRMSYFLWSSMPDDELFGLAHRDELHKPKTSRPKCGG